MSKALKNAFFAALLLASGVMMSGCTPWIEAKASQAERALNCATLAMNVPGAATAQSDACALHPAAKG